jgi:hypothetical protein
VAAVETFLHRHAGRDRGDAGEIVGMFQHQAIGDLRAVGPAGREDAFLVDAVRRDLMVEKGFDETDVVDL